MSSFSSSRAATYRCGENGRVHGLLRRVHLNHAHASDASDTSDASDDSGNDCVPVDSDGSELTTPGTRASSEAGS